MLDPLRGCSNPILPDILGPMGFLFQGIAYRPDGKVEPICQAGFEETSGEGLES